MPRPPHNAVTFCLRSQSACHRKTTVTSATPAASWYAQAGEMREKIARGGRWSYVFRPTYLPRKTNDTSRADGSDYHCNSSYLTSSKSCSKSCPLGYTERTIRLCRRPTKILQENVHLFGSLCDIVVAFAIARIMTLTEANSFSCRSFLPGGRKPCQIIMGRLPSCTYQVAILSFPYLMLASTTKPPQIRQR